MKDAVTTIKVKKSVVKQLEKLKVHPRQSNEEIIIELLRGREDA